MIYIFGTLSPLRIEPKTTNKHSLAPLLLELSLKGFVVSHFFTSVFPLVCPFAYDPFLSGFLIGFYGCHMNKENETCIFEWS